MSLHVGVLMVRGDVRRELPNLCHAVSCAMDEQPVATGVPFEEAWHRGNGECGVTFVDGWTVVWGQSDLFSPPLDYIARARDPQLYATAEHLAPGLASFSSRRELYFSVSDGTSGTYGMDYYIEGERHRSLWELEREIVRDEGPPLPEEGQFRRRLSVSEWGMIELLCHLTVPYPMLEASVVDIRRITWVPAPTPRRWWRF